MKKVLSVVLAAAMVLGMSVSAFAAKDQVWGASGNKEVTDTSVTELSFWDNMTVVRADGTVKTVNTADEFTLEPGDDLYFFILKNDATYTGDIDKDWSVNIKANDFVEKASFKTYEKDDVLPWGGTEGNAQESVVKVEIADDLDNLDSQTVKFYLYIADNANKQQSLKASLTYSFDNVNEKYVDFDWTNDADHAAKWIVAKGEKGTATFDFEDDLYYTVKMISEEKVVLNLSQAYDKTIDKDYNDNEAELDFYNFKGSKDSFTRKGELFVPSSKDNKHIYEIVDGEPVAVEAEYTETYKVAGVSGTAKKGYIIETRDLGYYVVADDELVLPEEETTEPATTEPAKENPGTGANDFVGAAVALAVVSVAAAGALAFKK